MKKPATQPELFESHSESVNANTQNLPVNEWCDFVAQNGDLVAGECAFRQGAVAYPEATAMKMKTGRTAATARVPNKMPVDFQAKPDISEKPHTLADYGLAISGQTNESPDFISFLVLFRGVPNVWIGTP